MSALHVIPKYVIYGLGCESVLSRSLRIFYTGFAGLVMIGEIDNANMYAEVITWHVYCTWIFFFAYLKIRYLKFFQESAFELGT
jgi:hypothetical protein